MTQENFHIGGLTETEQIEVRDQILKSIEEKKQNGVYALHRLAENPGIDFLEIRNDSEFLSYYLKVIKRTWAIDVNDFEIPAKRGFRGKAELLLKKILWKLLKFYTYRLYSQQIEFNSQIKNTLVGLEERMNSRMTALEREILKLKGVSGQ